MKKIKFLAIALVSLFIATNLASCSKTNEEKDAEKIVELIKEGKYDRANEELEELEDKYFEDGRDSKKAKALIKALDEELCDENAVIRGWLMLH